MFTRCRPNIRNFAQTRTLWTPSRTSTSCTPLLPKAQQPIFHNAILSYSALRAKMRQGIPGTRGIITGTYPADPLSLVNRKLLRMARDRQEFLSIFDKCQSIVEAKLKPDLTTYTVLLGAYECNNDLESIMNTLEEMDLVGIQPNISVYNIALKAAATNGDTIMMEKVRTMVNNSGLTMGVTSYEIIIQGLCANQELEHALDLLGDMTVSVNERGQPDENGRPVIDVQPSLGCYIPVIRLARSLREAETAYLVLKMAEVQAGLSRIPARVYTDLMTGAADEYVLPAVEYCWKKGVKELGSFPDEGTCMLVLNCAGRGKAPHLAAEVIQYMGENGMEFHEYHFAPLLQAFALAKKFKSAFNVLSIMRTSGMSPTILTGASLLKALNESADVEEAYISMREMYKEGKAIDVVAFNVLIEACGRNKDLTRATSIFEAASSLGVKPDTDSYNALLTGCIEDRNMMEGKNVITKMQHAGVDPNVDTYQSLIALCLTQINYEDAFMYLEEMKSHNVIPSEGIYTGLVRKLARESDPRLQLAVDEMESFGYRVGTNLREYIETGGLSKLAESERRRFARRRRSAYH